jgi:pyrroline-5-carboxylate reductase
VAEKTIGFIGGGRITRIFLEGFKRAGERVRNPVVSDISGNALCALQQSFPEIQISPNDNTRPASCDIVFLAVHPPVVGSVFPEVAHCLQGQAIFVSLAPKFTIPKLVSGLSGFDRVARMIPNAPSVVNAGYNPIAFSPTLSEGDKALLMSVLQPLGQCPVVADEHLEAYAIVTAMGPTYFWFQWLQLKELAVSFGLSEPDAKAGVMNMAVGAARTLFESGLSEQAVLDLIPARPLGEDEPSIRAMYESRLQPLFQKLKG